MAAHSRVPVRAALAVLWRQHGRLEVALVPRSGTGEWILPQVLLAQGETEVEAAARAARAVAPASQPGRFLGIGRDQVDTPEGTRPRILSAWAFAVPTESALLAHAGARWVTAHDAGPALASEFERAALERAADGALAVGRVILLRHCEAEQWRDGEDHLRPLTPVGRARAARLAGVVAALGVRELIGSPARRCAETLAPAAEAAGLAVIEEELFAEAAPDRDKAAAVLAERGRAGDAVLVCTHAPVVGALLERLAAARPALLPRPMRLDAGGAWCVEFDTDGVVGMHYLSPPPLEEGTA